MFGLATRSSFDVPLWPFPREWSIRGPYRLVTRPVLLFHHPSLSLALIQTTHGRLYLLRPTLDEPPIEVGESEDREVRWHPGEPLAVWVTRGHEGVLMRMTDLRRIPHPLFDAWVTNMQWSPTGRFLAVAHTEPSAHISLLHLAGHRLDVVASHPVPRHVLGVDILWCPGERHLFLRGPGGGAHVDLGTSEVLLLDDWWPIPGPRGLRGVLWKRRRRLAYWHRASGHVRYRIRWTGELEDVLPSPYGPWVVLVDRQKRGVILTGEGGLWRLRETFGRTPHEVARPPYYPPDGRRLLFWLDGTPGFLDMAEKVFRPLPMTPRQKRQGLVEFHPAPRLPLLAGSLRGDRNEPAGLVVWDLSRGQTSRVMSLQQAITLWAWHPNRPFFLGHTSRGLVLVDVLARRVHPLKAPHLPSQKPHGLVWEDRGRRFLLFYKQDNSIWLGDVEEGVCRRIQTLPWSLNWVFPLPGGHVALLGGPDWKRGDDVLPAMVEGYVALLS